MSEEITLKEYFQEKFDMLHKKLDTKFTEVESRLKKIEDETEVSRFLDKNEKIKKADNMYHTIYSIVTTIGLLASLFKIFEIF